MESEKLDNPIISVLWIPSVSHAGSIQRLFDSHQSKTVLIQIIDWFFFSLEKCSLRVSVGFRVFLHEARLWSWYEYWCCFLCDNWPFFTMLLLMELPQPFFLYKLRSWMKIQWCKMPVFIDWWISHKFQWTHTWKFCSRCHAYQNFIKMNSVLFASFLSLLSNIDVEILAKNHPLW